jgi:hypothetical protein
MGSLLGWASCGGDTHDKAQIASWHARSPRLAQAVCNGGSRIFAELLHCWCGNTGHGLSASPKLSSRARS